MNIKTKKEANKNTKRKKIFTKKEKKKQEKDFALFQKNIHYAKSPYLAISPQLDKGKQEKDKNNKQNKDKDKDNKQKNKKNKSSFIPFFSACKAKKFEDWVSYSMSFNPNLFKLDEALTQKNILSVNINIKPANYCFIRTKFMLNTNKERNIYYEPEYYYTFGYEDYHDNTWGLLYSNYQNNRFLSREDPYASSFYDGTWEVDYKTKVKIFSLKASLSYSHADASKVFSFQSSNKFMNNIKLKMKYEHYITDPQNRLSIAIKAKITDKIFAEGGIYLYSDLQKQKPYESDYYYSFGWKDERPKHFSFIYSNQYMATRFPWKDEPDIPFNAGSLTISYNF